MAFHGAPSLSIKHGVGLVPLPFVTVEEVLLAVGELIEHANLEYASRMNKGVLVFVKEERFVQELVASGVYIPDLFVQDYYYLRCTTVYSKRLVGARTQTVWKVC